MKVINHSYCIKDWSQCVLLRNATIQHYCAVPNLAGMHKNNGWPKKEKVCALVHY